MSEAMCEAAGEPAAPADAKDLLLAEKLVEWARAEGLSLTGPDGLLERLAKMVGESDPEPS
jgi:hypothetical protein